MASQREENSVSHKRFFRHVVFIAVLFALCDLAATFLFVRATVSMAPDHSSAQWEAAVVLFSDFGSNMGLDDESLRRLNFVLDLHRSGHAPVIICSGGTRPSQNLHGSAIMKRYLVERGIEESRVIEENHSNHTLGNLHEAIDILTKMRVERAVVVSSPIHLPRLRQMIATNNAGIIFDVASYDFKQCEPPLHWQSVYCQIHHEFAAWLMSAILSDDVYEKLMSRLRS